MRSRLPHLALAALLSGTLASASACDPPEKPAEPAAPEEPRTPSAPQPSTSPAGEAAEPLFSQGFEEGSTEGWTVTKEGGEAEEEDPKRKEKKQTKEGGGE